MAETQLTHKLRNPKSYNEWMNIWTSHIKKDSNNNITYEIYPSSNWKIPVSQLTPNAIRENNNGQEIINNGTASLPSNITIPVTQITNTNDTYNVTTSSRIGSNALIETDENGNLVAGPTAPTSNGDATYFLNQLGDWAQINTSFTVDLETVTEDNQEKPTSNAEFKVGNNSVIVKPQGKLAFSEVSEDNKEIQLSLGPIETTDLDLTTDDPEDSTKKAFRLPAKNIEDIPATQIINFNTAVNNAVKTNTKDNAGIVRAGNNYNSRGWLTDSEGNPHWRKVTADHMDSNLELNEKLKDNSISGSKFNTKLLGVFISKDEPYYNSYIDDLYTNPDTMEFRTIGATQDVEATFTDVGTITETMRLTIRQTSKNNNTIEISYIDKFADRSVSSSASINMLPDPTSVLYGCISKVSPYWNNTETKSPGYQARFISTLHEQINDYLTSCLTEPENHSEITYTKISDIFSSDLNDWDYNHLGIWVEI